MKRDVPPRWASLMVRAGLVDPRNDQASMSRLAEESGVHASTISAMMYGDRKTRVESVDKVAEAIATRLPGDDVARRARDVRALVDQAFASNKPFDLHPDAALLDQKERAVVNELIRLLARSKRASARPGLSVAPSTTERAIAAHDGEVPIAGEQAEDDHS